MKDFYDDKSNAEGHPFMKAFRAFQEDKQNCLDTMKMHKWQYEQYVVSMNRLQRLQDEEKKLLSIMPKDFSGDIIVERLTTTP